MLFLYIFIIYDQKVFQLNQIIVLKMERFVINLEVRIRDVDPVIVSKIDEMAKKLNQSRQVYLKTQIELMATDYMQSEKVSHLEKQLQANTLTLKEVTSTMNKMISVFNELMEDGDT